MSGHDKVLMMLLDDDEPTEELRKAVADGIKDALSEVIDQAAKERPQGAPLDQEKLKYIDAITTALIQGR